MCRVGRYTQHTHSLAGETTPLATALVVITCKITVISMSEDGSAILRYSMCLYSMYLVTLDVLLRVKNVG